MAKRYTRKDLRQQDEFVSFWEHAYQAIVRVGQPLVIGVAVLLVVVVASLLYAKHRSSVEADSSHQLARAMQTYNTELLGEQAGAEEADPDVPRFKTAGERRQEVMRQLDALLAAKKSGRVVEDALLLRAGLLLDEGKFDEAAKVYGDFLTQASRENPTRAMAREGRAYAFEGAGKLDDALGELGKLESESPLYKDRAQYERARLLAKKGDRAGAVKLYEAILSQHPKTHLRDDVSNRLAELRAETK